MSIVKFTAKEKELLARLMRAEALGEGDLGMLMVGNVVVNRVIGDCLDFRDIRSIYDAVYQSPGGFSGVNSSLFVGSPTAKEKSLAERILRGEYYHPATNALWFYAPRTGESCVNLWFNQRNAGRYKNHCFYIPNQGVCRQLH